MMSHQDKATLTRWFCDLRAGVWPHDLPIDEPPEWLQRALPVVVLVNDAIHRLLADPDERG